MKLIEHRLCVPTQYTPFSILPFACVHKDNEGHCPDKWKAFLREVKDTKYCIAPSLGDHRDWLRTHAREFLRQYREDRNSFNRLHEWRRQVVAEDARELEPIKDKIPFMSLGNHHHEFGDGTNDVQELCRLLGIPYGGKAGYLRLLVHIPDRPAHICLNILYDHGEKIGGGSTKGADLNAMTKKAEGFDFDILMLAHNHKKHGYPDTLLTVPKRGEMQLVEKPVGYMRAGCFMRGYVKDCVTYAETGLLNPTAIGHVRLDVLPKHGERGQLRYDFKVTF